MANKKCSLRVLSLNGKVLTGTAAQLSYISQRGGWDKYHWDIVSNVYDKIIKEQNRSLFRIAK